MSIRSTDQCNSGIPTVPHQNQAVSSKNKKYKEIALLALGHKNSLSSLQNIAATLHSNKKSHHSKIKTNHKKETHTHSTAKKSAPSTKVRPFFSWVEKEKKAKHLNSLQSQKIKEAFSKAICRSTSQKKVQYFKRRLSTLKKDKKVHLTSKNVAIVIAKAQKYLSSHTLHKPSSTPAPKHQEKPHAPIHIPPPNPQHLPLPIQVSPLIPIHQTAKQLIEIYTETKNKLATMPINTLNEMQVGTVIQKHPPKIVGNFNNNPKTVVEVLATTTIDAALAIQEQTGYRIGALNMADSIIPGGLVEDGASTQEESLFRGTSLSYSLLPNKNPVIRAQLHNNPYHVPEVGTIYSPKVRVIRDKNGHLLNANYPIISVISSAAPNITPMQPKPANYKELMKEKIRAVLRTAYQNHQTPLLSAWGCGAFNNDPEEVSGLFKDVFNEPEFQRVFPAIYFAITPGNNFNIFYNKLHNLQS
jgi:uncharacterized protein (TIGR02452 family)